MYRYIQRREVQQSGGRVNFRRSVVYDKANNAKDSIDVSAENAGVQVPTPSKGPEDKDEKGRICDPECEVSWKCDKRPIQWGCPEKFEQAGREDKAYPYMCVNFWAVFFHFLNGCLMLYLREVREEGEGVYKLSLESLMWKRANQTLEEVCAQEYLGPSGGGGCFAQVCRNQTNETVCDYAAGEFNIGASEETKWCGKISREDDVAQLSLFWLITWFHFLSAIFQSLAVVRWKTCFSKDKKYPWTTWFSTEYVYSEFVGQGRAPFRFVEYSISATLMLMSLGLILGVYSWTTQIGLAGLTCACMLCGLVSDQARVAYPDIQGEKLKEAVQLSGAVARLAHLVGWLLILFAWAILFVEFIYDVDLAEKRGIDVPDFVFVAVILLAVLYNAFGIVAFVQHRFCKCGPACCKEADKDPKEARVFNESIELAFVSLSLISKTMLGWVIYTNVLSGMDKNSISC